MSTAAVAWLLAYNRRKKTFHRYVDRYIAPTRFVADQLIHGGLPGDIVDVKYHFVPNPGPAGSGGSGHAVYVGRLSAEKGLRTMLMAWRALKHIPLKIIGEGELRSELEIIAKRESLPVEFLGIMTHDRVLEQLRQAELLIVPSEWYEVFGMVVIEAYSCGTPVIASRIGGLTEIISDGETGYTFEPGNPDDLARKILKFYQNSSKWPDFRKQARALSEKKFNAAGNLDALLGIYNNVIHDHRRG
jgi:glycosyltransferase involved in cell wall biosynthesis